MSSYSAENEFDFILKAREEARKVVENYKKYLDEAKEIDISFIDLKAKKAPRKIAALDGGERLKTLVASSVIVVRAGGGIFEQDKKIRKKIMHDLYITSMIQDVERFSNLIRDILEFKISLKLLEEEPEVLIMDGSLVGYFTKGLPNRVTGNLNKKSLEPGPINEYVEAYKLYMKTYDKLLKSCRKRKVLLLGVSKDSRVHYIVNKYGLNPILTDYSLLKVKMRRPCATNPFIVDIKWQNETVMEYLREKNYLQSDLASFYISYFKLKPGTLPIRVDFPEWQKDRFDEIMAVMETYHDQKGFLMTAHLVHNWAVMRESIVTGTVNAIKEEVLKIDPVIYDAIFTPQRRDEI
ncbi:MAG: DNA double-strand break repair nuclease NurA [Candidatus Helarchaeota archaeon]